MNETEQTLPAAKRWWIYQRERFPLLAHSPLVAAMSFGALGYAVAISGEALSVVALLSCWLGLLGFFFLLRVADEFKDYDTDCRHRPYRPVPRGLIQLRELALAGAAVAVIMLLLALLMSRSVGWGVLLSLLAAAVWMALMTREFFAGHWLEARPLLYLISHMLIMPLLMLYALTHSGSWREEFYALLGVAFAVGLCIEIGRKLRRPEDEETGVDTYSKVWGRAVASGAWLVSTCATLVLMLVATRNAGAGLWVLWPALLIAFMSLLLVTVYLRRPNGIAARGFEGLSALTTLTVYLLLGALLWI